MLNRINCQILQNFHRCLLLDSVSLLPSCIRLISCLGHASLLVADVIYHSLSVCGCSTAANLRLTLRIEPVVQRQTLSTSEDYSVVVVGILRLLCRRLLHDFLALSQLLFHVGLSNHSLLEPITDGHIGLARGHVLSLRDLLHLLFEWLRRRGGLV